MVRGWLKLEPLEATQHQQQHYLKYLEQLMAKYPASARLKELHNRHALLEKDLLDLWSKIETRIYNGKNRMKFGFEFNPLENDDRFEQETENKDVKHTLYLALSRFRAEPEFKHLNESLEDPASAEAKQLRIENRNLKAKIEGLKQTVSQQRGTLDSNDENISLLQEGNEFLINKLQVAEQEMNQAVYARLEAEKAKTHAESNHSSIRKAFENSDGRISELNKQINDLTKSKDYWREEHRKLNERFLNLSSRTNQRQPLAGPIDYPRNEITTSPHPTHTSARSVSTDCPIPIVSKERALRKLFAEVASSTPIPEPSASSGNNTNRGQTKVTSGSGPQVGQRAPSSLTIVQTRVTERMARMTDMQLESLEPAMKELEALHPGDHYHWVRGHWARDPNTKAFETTQDLERKKNSHSKLY